MTLWTDVLVSVFMEFMRLFIIKRYCELFFVKNRKMKYHWLPYLVSYFLTTSAYLYFHTLLINLVITFVGIWIITFAYECKMKRKILFATMILAISSVLDMISIFLLSENPTGDSYELISSFISVGLFLLSSIIVEQIFGKHTEEIATDYWWYLLLILFTSIVTLFVLSNDQIVSRTSVIAIGLTLLFLNFIVYYLYDAMIAKYQSEQENLLLREQMKVYDNQIRLNIDNERRIKALRHDMRHHLKEITDLAKENKNDELIAYIKEMEYYIKLDDNVVDTGNSAIDGILNYKIFEAKEKGITVCTHIAVPDEIQLPVFDMNIIFGNLLDNAMEALCGMDNPAIDLHIKYSQSCLFIKITNPYHHSITYGRDGKILSTKKDDAEHGFGMENVRRAVEKYYGDMSVRTEKDMFIVEIMLFLTSTNRNV